MCWILRTAALVAVASACGGDDDAPADGGAVDGGIDAPTERDGGPEGGVGDSGPMDRCWIGLPCTEDRGCAVGQCMPEIEIGYATDAGVMTVMWPGGYCTPSPVAYIDAPGACDPGHETSCGACGTCLFVGQQMGRDLTACLRRCTGSLTEQTCPQPTQECVLGFDVCWDGCVSDEECAVTFLDGRLVYDVAGMWTCNPVTRHCEHPGVATASAGDPCVKSSDCERNGRCLSGGGGEGRWPGGYCVKDGCLVEGNSCASDGVCQERRIGMDLCLGPCNFAQDPMTDRLGAGGHGADCRPGYMCVWNGVDPSGTPGNGACVPGNYNEVTTPNTGAPCTDDAQCYSPFGAGLCLDTGEWSPAGYCTIFDCGAPAMPPDLCGPDTQCALLFEDITACLSNCSTADDCTVGYACVQHTMDDPSRFCLPTCRADADCRTGETCDIPPFEMTGRCR